MGFVLPRVDTTSTRYPWYVLGAVCIGMVMGTFDFGAINAAYPTLAAAFDAPAAVISWIGISYSLTTASVMALFGRLGDMAGHKRVYLSGFVVYLVGAVLAGLSPGLGWLIAGRVVSGVGSAMLVANSLAIIGASFPANRRGTAIGAVETAVAVGLALGPIVGGVLAEQFGWRAIFFASWPAGLFALALGGIVLRDAPRKAAERFDFLGAALFAAGMVGLLLGLTLGATAGWRAPGVLVGFAAAAVLLPVFVLVERRVAHPMIALDLFRHPVFAAANAAKVCAYLSFMCTTFLAPFYLQRALGFAPAQVGLALTPIPVALSVAALIMGPLSDRVGTRLLATAGLVTAAVGAFLLSRLDPALGYPAVLVCWLVLVFGMGTFIAPNDSAILGSAPRERLGVASGILALTRSLGMIVGLALAGSLLSARSAYYLAAGADEAAAFLGAFHDVFRVVIFTCLLGAALCLVRARDA